MNDRFVSGFAADINGLRRWRADLGYLGNAYDFHLQKLDAFCCQHYPEQDILTWEIAISYLNEARSHRDIRLDVITLRHLASYQQMMDKPAVLFPANFFSYNNRKRPYIMSNADLQRFFDATDHYPATRHNPLLEYTVATIFRLQYATGMRPYEVRHLSRLDFDYANGTIYIADSKRHKDRRIAVSKEILAMCHRYDSIARRIYPHTTWFFPNRNQVPYSHACLRDLFKKCWDRSGNPSDLEYCTPYILRHNFATRRLSSWIAQGKNMDACIPYLSAYMGHETFSSTYYYIHLLPEHFSCTGLMGLTGIVPEVCHEK